MLASVKVCPLETRLKHLTLHERGIARDEAVAAWRAQSDDEASDAIFFFFCEPREQSCFICIRVTTEEGPRICVNLLSKCFGFCFHFLLRGKGSCAFSCNWFQIVQITCNTQLSSWLLLLLFPHPQSPSENKKGSELDHQLRGICGKLSP